MALYQYHPSIGFDSDDSEDHDDLKVDPELDRFCEKFTFEVSTSNSPQSPLTFRYPPELLHLLGL